MSFHRVCSLAIFCFLTVLPAHGQEPAFLVRDLNDAPKVMVHESWEESEGVGSLFYFAATDEIHGNEVWRSDGTPAGTFLLKDARPGVHSSYPRSLTRSNGLLFFAADSSGQGPILWKSDGTPEGTSPVKGDSFPGSGNGNFLDIPMIDAGDKLLFVIQSADEALELWVTDGTETHPAGDAARGFFSARFLAAANGQVLFAADPGDGSGLEPWVSDGTDAGTHRVADLNPTGGSILYYNPEPLGPDAVAAPWGGFVFMASDGVHGQELWRTDGTAAGTFRLSGITPGLSGTYPFGFTAVNGKVVFIAADPVHGREIWATDGTAAGTLLLRDVWPGSFSSDPRDLTAAGSAAGSQAFFRAADGTHGIELWVTDGTPAGTRLVKDLVPGAGDAFFTSIEQYVFTSLGGRLIFYAPGAGTTLYTSDGTAAGTQPVTLGSGLWPSVNVHSTGSHNVAGGRLFFQMGVSPSLWITDGTTAGSYRVLDLPLQTSAFDILDGAPRDEDAIADVGGALLFQATDSVFNYELWRSDGTAAGTLQVTDLTGDDYASDPDWFHAVDNHLAFRTYPNRLGLSDGTAAGTGIVPGISVEAFATKPLGNQLFFFSKPDSAPQGLWKTDGTEAGTVLVAAYDLFQPGSVPAPAGGKLFYARNNGWSYDLWVSDGTGPGTDIGHWLAPLNLTDAGGTLFFSSFKTSAYRSTLWKSDGTAAGTVQVKDISVVPPTSGARPFDVLPGGIVLFVGRDERGPELWRSDGTDTGTVLVKDILPGFADARISDLTVAGSHAFFVADDGVHGAEVWATDGTEAGTHLVRDIVPGAGSSLPYNLAAAGSTLVFTAFDPVYGVEAWRSDGTALGTRRLADVAPGPLSSSPMNYTLSGNNLFFVANDNTTGFELWAIPQASVQATFGDVPTSHWAWPFIEALAASGVTGGCSDGQFCPNAPASRAQAAILLLTARDGVPPPPATGTRFDDVPPGYWAGPWIEELAREGVVSGCSATPPRYCPERSLTRAEMAVLLTVARHETPPPATGTRFADVPSDHWAARWIEQLAADGITGGCGGGNYCPDQPITRGEMAVFLATAFHLPLP